MTATDEPGGEPPEPAAPPPPPAGSGTHVAAHAAPHTDTSRRWFLAGGLALVLGAGGGVAGAFAHGRDTRADEPRRPSGALLAAAAAERRLIADLLATTGGTPAARTIFSQLRADHAAHLRALDALLATYDRPGAASSAAAPTTAPTAAAGRPRTTQQLRAAELDAATAGAQRAGRLDGPLATLLASISACEATHADLLG